MKNLKIKYTVILIILILSSIAISAEVEKYSLPDNEGVSLFVLKGIKTTRQITIKGTELDINLIGLNSKKFEIFASDDNKDLKDLTGKINKKLNTTVKLNENDSEFMKGLRDLMTEFDMVKKEFELVMSLDDPAKVEEALKSKFSAKINFEKNAKELVIDMKHIRSALVLIPEDISLILDIDKGDIDMQNTNGEIVINGQQLETSISNVSAVINYKNKSGDIKINNYEGVANLKTLQGDMTVNSSSGKMSYQSSAGDIKFDKFIGDIDVEIKVGDVTISNCEDVNLKLENKSGDFELNNSSAKKVEINTASSDVKFDNTKAEKIMIENLSGDISLDNITADLNINLISGDLILNDFNPVLKNDSKIDLNFGDIQIKFKDPKMYNYFRSVNEEKLDFQNGLKLNKDLKICTKDKKCIIITLNNGQITVDKIK